GLLHANLVARFYFPERRKIGKKAKHVAGVGELRPGVGGDRRAAEGQGEGVALGPEADRAGVDDLLRIRLELRAHRRLEVDLLAPGLGVAFERSGLEEGA